MTKTEVVYKLKHAGWTYRDIGEFLGVRKQWAFVLYSYEEAKTRKANQDKCDLCDKHLPSVITNHQKSGYKLCSTCTKTCNRFKKYASLEAHSSSE